MSIQTTNTLGAVNTMLSTIGEAPVNSLLNLEVNDAILAVQILEEVNVEVQTEGWTFNTDAEFKLSPEQYSPHEILIPPNALQVYPNDSASGVKVRGNRLFDGKRQSFSFEGLGPVSCNIVWGFGFDELPENARRYIAIRAARMFQDRAVGSDTIHVYSRNDEMQAYARLKKFEGRSKRPNYLQGLAAARILQR